VSELIIGELNFIGYCDASAFGADSVCFGGQCMLAPIVWRIQWPQDITKAVVSDANPQGSFTNSDLKMAGVLLQEAVLEAYVSPKMESSQSAIGCNNSPLVAGTTCMATRSALPILYHLLKGFAMQQ
jgi:hypothetical protein